MADPLSLSVIGGVVLTEGIKFLYRQAGEVLKRWHERKAQASAGPQPSTSTPLPIAPPPILQGRLEPPVIHFDRLEALEDDLRQLRQGLSDYADGVEDGDPNNHDLLLRVDALRQVLETIYGQRITFQGEPRPASGTPIVVGIAEVKQVVGYVAGVRAKRITGGEVRGSVIADRVEKDGEAIGVDVDTIGGLPSPAKMSSVTGGSGEAADCRS